MPESVPRNTSAPPFRTGPAHAGAPDFSLTELLNQCNMPLAPLLHGTDRVIMLANAALATAGDQLRIPPMVSDEHIRTLHSAHRRQPNLPPHLWDRDSFLALHHSLIPPSEKLHESPFMQNIPPVISAAPPEIRANFETQVATLFAELLGQDHNLLAGLSTSPVRMRTDSRHGPRLELRDGLTVALPQSGPLMEYLPGLGGIIGRAAEMNQRYLSAAALLTTSSFLGAVGKELAPRYVPKGQYTCRSGDLLEQCDQLQQERRPHAEDYAAAIMMHPCRLGLEGLRQLMRKTGQCLGKGSLAVLRAQDAPPAGERSTREVAAAAREVFGEPTCTKDIVFAPPYAQQPAAGQLLVFSKA